MDRNARERLVDQEVSGNDVRNAGQDYYEISIVEAEPGGALCSLSQADLDERSLERERLFLARFGFDAGAARRKAILDFKSGGDLTDCEVSRLYRSGNLRFQNDAVRVANWRTLRACNWIAMGFICVKFTFFVLVSHLCLQGGATVTLDLAVTAIAFGEAFWAKRCCLIPAAILRRAQSRVAHDKGNLKIRRVKHREVSYA